jgi:hypothetical protein
MEYLMTYEYQLFQQNSMSNQECVHLFYNF